MMRFLTQPLVRAGESPRSARRSALGRWGSVAIPLVGAALIWASLGFAGYAAGWTVHKHRANAALVAQVDHARHAPGAIGSSPGVAGAKASAPCVQAPPQVGQLAGILSIPALGLQAPVEEGTDDAELSVAAGHAPASVWPGEVGASVLLAHDVSYFVHLGDLQAGELVTYRNQCTAVSFRVTGKQVVVAGAPVYNSTTPTLVLDTCWPTNALFYTSQRLLVTADEVPTSGMGPGGGAASATASSGNGSGSTGKGSPDGQSGHAGVSGRGKQGNALQVPATAMTTFTTPAPPALVAQGLTLTQNEAPMGTMTLTGATSPGWEESPGPMALEAAALQGYFGGLHAAAQQRADWWSAIAPGVAMPPPLVAATITGHDAPLDVSIGSTAGVPTTVTLATTVTLGGGAAPGTYRESVDLGVAGSVVTIRSWTVSHA